MRIIGKLSMLIIGCFCLIGCSKTKELVIELNSNHTTGYGWEYTVSEEDYIEIDSDYVTDCPTDMVGCGGKEIFKIKGLKEGKVVLDLKYVRSWEDEEPLETATYEITIDKNLNIVETHKGSYFEEN